MTVYCMYEGHESAGHLLASKAIEQWNQDNVTPLFESYTELQGTGHWRGMTEPSTIVEVISDDSAARANIDAIAAKYVAEFKQDAVLVTAKNIESDLVGVAR